MKQEIEQKVSILQKVGNQMIFKSYDRSADNSTSVSVCRAQGVTPMTRSAIYYLNISRQNWELNKWTRYLVKLKYNIY